MTCSSCGARNVEFATTCFSCRQPLGKLAAVTAPEPAREKRQSSPRVPAGAAAGKSSAPGGALVWLLFLAALAWTFGRGFLLKEKPGSEPAKEVSRPAVTEAALPQEEALLAEEQNGFRLVHFEWGLPSAGPNGSFRVGETVTGRSEIQGFGVTEDQRIDVTVTLAFLDPTGKLVEPVSPNVLRQPKESDSLFTSFDYAIPAEGPAGKYVLVIAVDDAVTSRSARFHRDIAVEAARGR